MEAEPEKLHSRAAGQAGQGEVPGTAAGARPAAQASRDQGEAGQCRQPGQGVTGSLPGPPPF